MELLKLNDILTLIPPPLIIWNIAHDPGPQQRHHRPWRPMLALASEFSFEWRNVERRQCAPRPPPSGENFSYRSNSGEHRTRDPGLGLKCLLPLHLPTPVTFRIPQPHELFPALNKAAENPPNKKRHWMLELPSWKKFSRFASQFIASMFMAWERLLEMLECWMVASVPSQLSRARPGQAGS